MTARTTEEREEGPRLLRCSMIKRDNYGYQEAMKAIGSKKYKKVK